MKLKIQGGTARLGDPPLCHTCKWAMIARGTRLRDERINCQLFDEPLPFKVTSCTKFVDQQHPSLREMEDIAWVLRTDATRTRVGFVHATKLKYAERYVLTDD